MIATDPVTIMTIQGVGFSFRKPGSFQAIFSLFWPLLSTFLKEMVKDLRR